MSLFLAQYEWNGYRVRGLIPDLVIHLRPEPDWLLGRKGLRTAEEWEMVKLDHPAGMLVMDNDVAADPDDMAAMADAVTASPGSVHTGMVKLWPASTGRPGWIWSHRGGQLGRPLAHRDEAAPVAYFATGFTWLPARLLDLASRQLAQCTFHEFDVVLSEVALRHDIPSHAVKSCRPKHLHF